MTVFLSHSTYRDSIPSLDFFNLPLDISCVQSSVILPQLFSFLLLTSLLHITDDTPESIQCCFMISPVLFFVKSIKRPQELSCFPMLTSLRLQCRRRDVIVVK